MKDFMDADFLLQTETAKKLYHECAESLPIIDYHCHLNPKMIADDYRFKSITELWLGGDHYKWRALRANGIKEHFITGKASDWEKFQAWAETVPYTLRNPLYHWTHMELRTGFGIDKLLNPKTAREIYDECNALLQRADYSARGFMRRYGVEVVCTTDDPVDSLECHKRIRESGFEIKVLPTWRPDKAMAVDNPKFFAKYIKHLSEVSGCVIRCYKDLLEALKRRHDFFAEMGCRLSDHGIEEFYADDYTPTIVDSVFATALNGKVPDKEGIRMFKSAILHDLAVMDHDTDWTQQFHFGPIRNLNTRMFNLLGPDTGHDSIGDVNTARSMARFFDFLAVDDKLAKTIVYNLNPAANTMVATMIGNFQDGSIPGKMQWGSGWWFLDQKGGIENQLNTLSEQGLLSRFVGMLTDSRSFLSYPRHHYFRRILCNLIGRDVENGEIPIGERERVRQMVSDICYYNAKRYFQF